jgi:Co/Zn/Cd efflux system component
MKILMLKIDGKTYTTGKITAFMSKEALKIQKDALALAKTGKSLQDNTDDLELVNELLDKLVELKDRKVWVICEVYGNQFTADAVEKNLDDDEIDAEINKIIYGIAGIVTKN